MNFPHVVKFKARRQNQADYIPKAAKVGKTYDDFLFFIEGQGLSAVGMDTVVGFIGGK